MTATHPSAVSAVGRLEALTIVCVVGVLALGLGIVALLTPRTVAATQAVDFTQSGAFHYSASAPSSSLYGADGLTTGEPIVTTVVESAQMHFDYRFAAKDVDSVHGTASLAATVGFGNGLSRVFPMTSKATFTGPTAAVTGTLPVAAIDTYARTVSEQLGSGTPYGVTVSIRPTVTVRATASGQTIAAHYSPALLFTLTGTIMTVTQQSGSSAGADPLHPSATGSGTITASVANTVPLLIIHPPVSTTRYVALSVAALCLLLGLWLARPLFGRSGAESESERIHAVYGARIVAVDGCTAPAAAVADVVSMESLAHVARRYESVIMHVSQPHQDAYLVWDNGILYRYRTECAPSAAENVTDDTSRHGAGGADEVETTGGGTPDRVDILVREILERADRA